jgi:hypothetical protein
MTQTNNPSTGGGAATQAGINFQNRVAAWVAVRILSEVARGRVFGLAEIPRLLQCETDQPVDDLLVGSRTDAFAFAQSKHSIDLSESPASVFAEVVDQFTRQTLQDPVAQHRPWDRKLDPERDALLLIVGPGSSGVIREALRNVLEKVRRLLPSQPVTDAASNAAETRALDVITDHFTKSYHDRTGRRPNDLEVRNALRLFRVEILDVDPGGLGEREALDTLRDVVLRNVAQADAAWSTLVDACAHMAETHRGADFAALQGILLKAGFNLKVPHSYQADVDELGRTTERTEGALADLARIQVGATTVRVDRAVTQEIRRLTGVANTLIVGEPGAGKSGALSHFVEGLKFQQLDFVALAVDRLEAASESQLQSELHLQHRLDEVLENWPGTGPAYLVIDALDAARGGPGAKAIRDMIARVSSHPGRWRIVASIRKFDLRYGDELRDLFALKHASAAAPEFREPEFSATSHVNVRPLSETELADVQAQSSELAALIARAPAELRKLLPNPFNLRLLGALLGSGISVDQLTPMRTQLDLLDRYWRKRVLQDDDLGYAREAILRRACEGMTAARRLRVDQADVVDTAGSSSLSDLLSGQVLVEWQSAADRAPNRYVLAFSHNVLFDYSAERLLLRGNRSVLVQRIEQQADMSIILRPSFVFHFQHLWTEESPASFWDFVFQVAQSPSVTEIGKLIGPSAAADLVRTAADFQPLYARLNAGDETARRLGQEVLQHVIGAALVAPRDKYPLVGPDARPWSELAERVSRNLEASSAYPLSSLLTAACDSGGEWTSAQLALLSTASRRLLEYAWASPRNDEWLVARALESVCRTFSSEPAASAALLRHALVLEHLQQHGYQEMPWLAREIRALMVHDPVLVEAICVAAFEFHEDSNDPTAMNPSRILRLSGNKRQDYEMARFELANLFSEFQAGFPENAARAAIGVVDAYVREKRHLPDDATTESFEFRGRAARILTDYSSIWDGQLSTRNDEALQILDALTRHCEKLAEEGRLDEFRRLLDIVIERNRLSVFWRRLLGIATKYPTTVGPEFASLVVAAPVLTNVDTTQPCGDYLRACFTNLSLEQRELVERAILALTESGDPAKAKFFENLRNRMLGCIGLENLLTEEAKAILTPLLQENAVPENAPPVRFDGSWRAHGEREHLMGKGVAVDAPANLKIQQLEEPVTEFAGKFRNTNPIADDVNSAVPALRALHEALLTADADGVQLEQSDSAWGVLAEGCERVARFKELSCDDAAGQFVKQVLLAASNHPNPLPEHDNERFDEFPSWSGPSARISAAQGLTALSQQTSCATPDVLDAVERLSQDPAAPVRLQVADRLVYLYRTDQPRMWKIIRAMGTGESGKAVLSALLNRTVGQISGAHPQEVAEFIQNLLSRNLAGPGADAVTGSAVGILCGLHVWRAHALSGQLLDSYIAAPVINAELLSQLQFNLRDELTHGAAPTAQPGDDAIRRRALDVFLRIIQSAKGQLREIERVHSGTPFDAWPETERENVKRLIRVLDHAAKEIYFASGAYDNRRQNRRPGQEDLTTDKRRRFFEESRPILDALTDSGLPSIAHNLLQTLESFVSFDPRAVFLSARNVVRAGVSGGYQFEQMAADLVVRLVERYLAECRELLQDDPECRQALIELLDTFVRAGWPAARQLTYRLEDIFR